MVTPPSADFELHVPEGTATRLMTEIAAIPADKWVSWRLHRVEEGETFGGLAKKYRLPAAAIAEANNTQSDALLAVGQKLIIPASAAARDRDGTGKLVRYRVRRGDTLELIADQFSVSVRDLKAWNRIRGDRVARGMTLNVYPGGKPSRSSTSRAVAPKAAKPDLAARATLAQTAGSVPTNGQVTHRVKPGETLWAIAKAYQTTVEALREANRFLFSRQLQVGDQLVISPGR
jgi:LysM repeat protein